MWLEGGLHNEASDGACRQLYHRLIWREKVMRYLNVHAGTVERLYYEFSDDGISWLIHDKQILEDFAEWLSCVNL